MSATQTNKQETGSTLVVWRNPLSPEDLRAFGSDQNLITCRYIAICKHTLRHHIQFFPSKSLSQPCFPSSSSSSLSGIALPVFLTTLTLLEAPVCPGQAAPWVVGMFSCAAGHDRPMSGQASALHSTEQLIDNPHWGRWDSSSVSQSAAGDEDAVWGIAETGDVLGDCVTSWPLLPGPQLLGKVSLLAEGEGCHRSRCSGGLRSLSRLAVMCCATSVRAEVCHIASHLPHGTHTHTHTETETEAHTCSVPRNCPF